MQKVVVLTGAGISAESGLKTFRDSNGLWEQYRIEDVATPEAWHRNRKLVLDFYNQRRKQVLEAMPNVAHLALAEFEKRYDVHIITQNIDDLHERAGSTKVLHLHGEIRKARSSVDANLIYEIDGWELKEGEKCEKGSQLRPFIVWFGEMVPELENAARIVSSADVFLVIGTSLQVYPAAGLIHYAPYEADKYYIDPKAEMPGSDFKIIKKNAGEGVPELVNRLLTLASGFPPPVTTSSKQQTTSNQNHD
jgi:NAD-dependent deacetylase